MKEKDQYAAQNAQVVNQLYEEEQKYRNLFQQSIHAIYVTNEASSIFGCQSLHAPVAVV